MLISRITPQLRTRDLDASIRFYTEKVGLTLDFRYSDFYAGIRAGDQVFHLKRVDSADPSGEPAAVRQRAGPRRCGPGGGKGILGSGRSPRPGG